MLAPLKPPRRLLFGPGPTMVELRVYRAMTQPVTISGTGSAGIEAAVANFVEPGSKFVVLANGYFCDRITEMARRQGASIARLEKPWGEAFDKGEAAEFIRREKPGVVAFVQAETSTGVFQTVKTICEAAHSAGALAVADCVTSLAPVSISSRALDWLKGRKTAPADWYPEHTTGAGRRRGSARAQAAAGLPRHRDLRRLRPAGRESVSRGDHGARMVSR